MLIFLNGSINAGKTTTSRVLADKLRAAFIDLDDVRHMLIRNTNLEAAIPITIEAAAKLIQVFTSKGYDVVANYVLREQDYVQLLDLLDDNLEKHFFTLAPPLEVALQDRGERVLSYENRQRIRYHYKTNIHQPSFGKRIDNSHFTVDEVVRQILTYIKH